MHEAKAGETRSETRSETRAPESGAELGEFADQEFVPIQLTVNGRRVRQLVEARLLLSDFLVGICGRDGVV